MLADKAVEDAEDGVEGNHSETEPFDRDFLLMPWKQSDEGLDLRKPQEGIGDDTDDAYLQAVDDVLDYLVCIGVAFVILV